MHDAALRVNRNVRQHRAIEFSPLQSKTLRLDDEAVWNGSESADDFFEVERFCSAIY